MTIIIIIRCAVNRESYKKVWLNYLISLNANSRNMVIRDSFIYFKSILKWQTYLVMKHIVTSPNHQLLSSLLLLCSKQLQLNTLIIDYTSGDYGQASNINYRSIFGHPWFQRFAVLSVLPKQRSRPWGPRYRPAKLAAEDNYGNGYAGSGRAGLSEPRPQEANSTPWLAADTTITHKKCNCTFCSASCSLSPFA